MAERQLPKLHTRVRFPSPAPPRMGPRSNFRPDPSSSHCRAVSFLVRGCLLLIGVLPAHAQQEAVPSYRAIDSLEARVQGCVTCHGQSGQGTSNGYFPRIAGKPAAYLYNQLVAFRDGVRQYPPMNYLVAYLPDAYLREMAEHYSKLRPAYAPKEPVPADPQLLPRGKTLATEGDAARQIPACVTCHGTTLTGMNPGIPGLVGLRSAYIAAQLTRWRGGERGTAEPARGREPALMRKLRVAILAGTVVVIGAEIATYMLSHKGYLPEPKPVPEGARALSPTTQVIARGE